MEVEFLSNARYDLFVSKEDWTLWYSKFGQFADFFDKASRMPTENEVVPTTPVLQVSPTPVRSSGRNGLPSSPASKLSSPPTTGHLRPQQTRNPLPNVVSFRAQSPARQLPGMDFPQYSQKRSWDDGVEEQPSMRMAVPNNNPNAFPSLPAVSSVPVLPPVMPSVTMPLSVTTPTVPAPRLPQLNDYQATSNSIIPTTLPPTPVSQLPLPNLRAMSTVHNPSTTWSQQVPSATAPAPSLSPLSLYNSPVSLPDPVRGENPYPVTTSTGTISSTTAFPVHTPQTHLSPSFFLVNRSSPYRPVRAVNTLLIPPPSAFHQPRNVSMDQMHYQPLGKTVTERRTGVLPYLHHDAWMGYPASQQISPCITISSSNVFPLQRNLHHQSEGGAPSSTGHPETLFSSYGHVVP